MSKLRPVWVSDRLETHFALRSKPLARSHDTGEIKLRSTWNSFRFLRSVWVFRSTWNFHLSRKIFHFGAKWLFKARVIDIPGVPLAIKTIKISFKVTQLDLNAVNQCQYLPQNNHNCSISGRKARIVWYSQTGLKLFMWGGSKLANKANTQTDLKLRSVWVFSCEGSLNKPWTHNKLVSCKRTLVTR